MNHKRNKSPDKNIYKPGRAIWDKIALHVKIYILDIEQSTIYGH